MNLPAKTIEIAPGIAWVGVEDFHRRTFDAVVPLPEGTSYNAYLVRGKSRTALIDTVNPGFETELLNKIASLMDPGKIDYLIMNHAEPDHAGSIPAIMAAAPKAQLVATRKGVEMAGLFYHVPEERQLAIREGDTLELGGKTLRFIEAPWLHWPETMFTFAVEDGVLFPCDFFGVHLASDRLFDDEADDLLLTEAKRYFASIMMPFNKMVVSGLDKAQTVEPKVIAPSHGPVYRNPARIMDAYERWARGPLAPKALVVYVSMWRSTEALAKAVISGLTAEGVEAIPIDLTLNDATRVARESVDASALILGSPAFMGGLHPLAGYIASMVKTLRPRLKIVSFFGSYGWGGGAAAQAARAFEQTGCEFIRPVEVKGAPGDKDLADATELGRTVARHIRASLAASTGTPDSAPPNPESGPRT